MAKENVAGASEVLEALTSILRKEEDAKPGEVLRAAELLGKRYGLFSEGASAAVEAPQIIVDVPKGKDGGHAR
ncbi:MAG: hypothetical protein RSB91_01505 [Clostridia bacterium]